jgi:hypothetical protein
MSNSMWRGNYGPKMLASGRLEDLADVEAIKQAAESRGKSEA